MCRYIVLFLLLLAPTIGHGQACNVASTNVSVGMGGDRYVTKYFNGAGNCYLYQMTMVQRCRPDAGMSTPVVVTLLDAKAGAGSTNPSCSWRCDCGSGFEGVSITTADGLPVELIDFSIDD